MKETNDDPAELTLGWPAVPEPPGPVDAGVSAEPVLEVARPA